MVDEDGAPTRAEARRRAMLDAATALFLEKGFERTTLSDIVKRSGGSRTTLYEQFGGKEGLLRAMIEESTRDVWEKVRWNGDPPPLTEDVLVEYAVRLAKAISTPDAIAVYRIVFAESPRMPDIGELFMARGPGVLRGELTEWFARTQAEGRLTAGTAEELVQGFVGLALGDAHLCIGIADQECDEAAMRHYIRVAVRIFLNGAG